MRHTAWLSAVFLLMLVTGCGQIPTHELSQYRNAFTAAQNGSEEILVDFAAAIEAAEKRRAATPAPASAGPFSTTLSISVSPQPTAVEVRRTALRTIDTFNNVLTTLAEGKSVAAVQNTAGGFIKAAQNFVGAAGGGAVPGLSAVTGIVNALVGEMEKARLRREFEQAVRNGVPIISKIVGALIADREGHITLRAAEANLRQIDIVDDITTQAQSVRTLLNKHSAPARENDPRETLEKALNTALKPAERAYSFALPVKLAYGVGGPPFAEDQRILAQQAIALITERAAAFDANVKQFESLRSALNDYGAMLEHVQRALAALVNALDEPQALDKEAEELFAVAFSLNRDLDAFKAARRGPTD